MGTLYILKSLKNGSFYIGSTNNLVERVKQHKTGKSKYTKNVLPVGLVYNQKFKDLKTARRAEWWLKKQKDRKLVEKIISEGKINKKF